MPAVRRLYLDPIGRAASTVRAVSFLTDNTLKPELVGSLEKFLPAFADVLAVDDSLRPL